MLTPADIARHDESPPPPGCSPWVDEHRPRTDVTIVEPDPRWALDYELLERRLRDALGARVLYLAHVGSTAVPGLAAKPIIDVDLTVASPSSEAGYVPDLERAGFALVVREPWWQEHRCLIGEDPRCNVHVFPPGAPEPVRHLIFRDWLRAHDDDRVAYEQVKREAAAASVAAGEHVMDYNARKQDVIRDIYARAFRASGVLD